MRAKTQTSDKNKRAEYKSYAVKVEKFITAKDELGNVQSGVQGINLVTGKSDRFFMTVPKNDETAARYKNRPSLDKWSKPFLEFGTEKEIQPGAVMFFKDCIPFKGKDDPMGEHYKAIWVDRLGDNPQMVQGRLVRGYMVVEGQYKLADMVKGKTPILKESGEPVQSKILTGGYALSFEHSPAKFITGTPGDELNTQIAAALSTKNNPQLLVRFMDVNNNVCAEVFGSKSWEDKTTQRSPKDASLLWGAEINDLIKAIPDAESVSIIPVEKYALSKEGIEKGHIGPAFKGVDHATHYYDEGTKLCNLQQCYGMVGMGEYTNILNKLDCVEKGNKDLPAKDPTLLGGLEYSSSFEANMEFLEAASSDDEKQGQDAGQESEETPAP